MAYATLQRSKRLTCIRHWAREIKRRRVIVLCCLPGTTVTLLVALTVANGSGIWPLSGLVSEMQPTRRSDGSGNHRPGMGCTSASKWINGNKGSVMKLHKLLGGVILSLALMTGCSNVPSNQPMAGNAPVVAQWLNIPFVDAKAGRNITLANYAGKTVVVEAMAVWCAECFYQQTQAAQALKQLNRETVVYISLDIDPSADTKLLTDYATRNNFTWTFGSSNKALMEALVAQFGRAITSPSNMPIFMISPSGKVSKLYTGGHTADQLIQMINEWAKV